MAEPAPLQSFLPTCVDLARKAADRLHETILCTPFPDINDLKPSSDDEVQSIVNEALEWSRRVGDSFGTFQDKRPPGSVHAVFRRPDNYDPRQANLEHAAYVLGDIPSEYSATFAELNAAVIGAGNHRILAGQRGTVPVSSDLVHWAEIKGILLAKRQIAFAQALGLVAWVRGRVHALEQALLPIITEIEDAERGGKQVEVAQAGLRHPVMLTAMQSWLLFELAEKASVQCTRVLKLELVDKISEIATSIKPQPGRRKTSNETIYAMDQVMRARIHRRPHAAPKN